jgi:ferrous iron transport protein A
MRNGCHAVPLSRCVPGMFGTVISVECEPRFRLRLAEMGFTQGAPVRVVRSAPLGDPLEVEVRGYRLCLRLAEAAGILVETEKGEAKACRPGSRRRRECSHGRGAPHRPGREP